MRCRRVRNLLVVLAWLFCLPTFAAPPEIAWFARPVDALLPLIPNRAVLAFGEFHEIEGKGKAISALVHFRDELLPALLPQLSDLVVETWVTTGRCGTAETSAVAQVQETTQRPETTENEIVTLLRRAKEGGTRPHVLEIDCHDYASLTDSSTSQIDYVKLLGLVTRALERTTVAALSHAAPGRAVAIYGGALHNDVFPRKELAAFSFAKAMKRKTKGRYLEVDLYVPEYIEHDDFITQQPWYRRYVKALQPGQIARVRRNADSYILVFPRNAVQ